MAQETLAPLLTARLIILTDDGANYPLTDFLSYEVNQNIFQPCDSFNFKLALSGKNSRLTTRDVKATMAVVKPDAVFRIELGDDRVLTATGIVGRVEIVPDRSGGLTMTISGRDAMQVFTDNSMPPGFSISNKTLPEIMTQLAQRYRNKGIRMDVISDNAANRNIMSGKRYGEKRFQDYTQSHIRIRTGLVAARPVQQPETFVGLHVQEAKPHEGEREFQFLERHARNLGVMLWTTCEGDFFMGRPADGQAPIYSLRRSLRTGESNILSGGGRVLSNEGTYSRVTCLGHREGKGDFKWRTKAVVLAPVQPKWPRELVVHDSNAKTNERAMRIAVREMGRAGANRDALEFPVHGFGQRGLYYVPDTVADVDDEWTGAKGYYYITGRTIRGDRGQGEMTTLRAVPVGTITL